MKTVKRKAEVGERIVGVNTGKIYEVENVLTHWVQLKDGGVVSDGLYEVIIEDEPSIPPHSSHYHQNGLDPLEVMRRTFPPEQYEGFLRGSLLKYTMRYDRKGQEKADLEKAEFYSEALKRWKEGAE